MVSRSTSRERFHMLLMSVFGGVSLLLAAIGIYGLMAYSVEQRTQEIGIRMALGAEHRDVRAMVIRQGMIFALIGVVVGIGGAFAMSKQIASFLFGVTAWDPLVFGTIPVVLLATAIIILLRYVFRGYAPRHRSKDNIRSRCRAAPGFHGALRAASRALFEDLRFCSNRRNRCASMTMVT